jgi:hypothetical protein
VARDASDLSDLGLRPTRDIKASLTRTGFKSIAASAQCGSMSGRRLLSESIATTDPPGFDRPPLRRAGAIHDRINGRVRCVNRSVQYQASRVRQGFTDTLGIAESDVPVIHRPKPPLAVLEGNRAPAASSGGTLFPVACSALATTDS